MYPVVLCTCCTTLVSGWEEVLLLLLLQDGAAAAVGVVILWCCELDAWHLLQDERKRCRCWVHTNTCSITVITKFKLNCTVRNNTNFPYAEAALLRLDSSASFLTSSASNITSGIVNKLITAGVIPLSFFSIDSFKSQNLLDDSDMCFSSHLFSCRFFSWKRNGQQ